MKYILKEKLYYLLYLFDTKHELTTYMLMSLDVV